MLDALRQGAQGWVSKTLMILLVLSFAIWGVSGQFAGYGAGTLATVGGTEVSVPEFARTLEQVQRSGQQVPHDQILNSLLLDAALQDEARRQNLGVSDDQVAKVIAEDTRFHGQNGSFDRQVFDATLRNSGIAHDDYLRDLRQDTVRDQIASSVAAGIDVPQPVVEALYRFQNEARTVSFLPVDAAAIEPVGEPDAAALQSYFDANADRFRAPEYRKLGLLTLDPAALADPAAVTPEELAAEYERRKASFTRPERRRIEQVRFPTPEAATQALQATQGGTDFAALPAPTGGTAEVTDLGFKTRAEVIDPAIAATAFAAQPNAVVAVTEGALEPSLIRVTEIEAGSVTPQAEVEPRLRSDLATRMARERIGDIYNAVEDERAGGATLAEIAAAQSLPYREVPAVARDGTAPDGGPVADLPSAQQLLQEAFESDVGVENNPIRGSGETFVFYDVLELIPERERTLDEARVALVSAWKAEETDKRVADRADALMTRLKAGEALATLAAEIGGTVSVVENVKRGAPPAGLSANAAAQAFAGPQGHVANAEGDAPPARVLLRVDAVSVPAYFAEAADAKAIKAQLAGQIRNDILQSYNRQLLESRETTVNNAALAQLTGTPQAQ